jgi:hypothetical protein
MISRALRWRSAALPSFWAWHFTCSTITHADVPSSADMTACNQEAREESRDRSA